MIQKTKETPFALQAICINKFRTSPQQIRSCKRPINDEMTLLLACVLLAISIATTPKNSPLKMKGLPLRMRILLLDLLSSRHGSLPLSKRRRYTTMTSMTQTTKPVQKPLSQGSRNHPLLASRKLCSLLPHLCLGQTRSTLMCHWFLVIKSSGTAGVRAWTPNSGGLQCSSPANLEKIRLHSRPLRWQCVRYTQSKSRSSL